MHPFVLLGSENASGGAAKNTLAAPAKTLYQRHVLRLFLKSTGGETCCGLEKGDFERDFVIALFWSDG